MQELETPTPGGQTERDRTEDGASLVSSDRRDGRAPNSKVLNARLTNFIEMLDTATKSAKPVANMKDFELFQKLTKENKQIQRGVVRYLEMITSNPNTTDLANTVTDYMDDRVTQKALFKANLKDPDNVARMKKDTFTCSLKIAGYGRREMWMPDKANFKPSNRKHKPGLIRFDRDGNAVDPGK